MLLQVIAPHFCAAVVVMPAQTGGWYVSNAAPILHYMEQWRLHQVTAYVERKGWTVRIVPEGK